MYALAGHKRPFRTIILALMQKGDQHIGFGITGGLNPPLAHVQFISNVVDFYMNNFGASDPRYDGAPSPNSRISPARRNADGSPLSDL
jgi:gamma-glutamyltranspeptidase